MVFNVLILNKNRNVVLVLVTEKLVIIGIVLLQCFSVLASLAI